LTRVIQDLASYQSQVSSRAYDNYDNNIKVIGQQWRQHSCVGNKVIMVDIC
jgi:hypothetical protein